MGVIREGGADPDLDVFGCPLAHHQVVHLLEVGADGVGELVPRHPHRLAEDGAAQAEHRHLGGAAADVNNHGAHRFGDRQAGPDRSGDRLLDQMHFPSTGQTGFTHGAAFDTGDTARNADHQPGSDDAAAVIALLDEGLDHLLGGIEIRDHPIPQGTNGADVAGGATEHQLRLIAHGERHTPLQIEGHHRGLLQHNAAAGDVHQGVGRSQIDTDVARELEPSEKHRSGPLERFIIGPALKGNGLEGGSGDGWYIRAGGWNSQKVAPPRGAASLIQSHPLQTMGVNSVTLVGRAGRDPEVRYFESGSVVANLTLAVNRRSRDDEPDWFNLEIWGKQAQVAADYVRKGSLVGIIGSLKLDRWTDRTTGEERSKPVVRVDRLELLGSKRDAEAGGFGGGGGSFGGGAPSDEEVPF